MEESSYFIFGLSLIVTWLNDRDICNDQIQLPGYKMSQVVAAWMAGIGGICLFSWESIKLEVLNQFDEINQEVLQVLSRLS